MPNSELEKTIARIKEKEGTQIEKYRKDRLKGGDESVEVYYFDNFSVYDSVDFHNNSPFIIESDNNKHWRPLGTAYWEIIYGLHVLTFNVEDKDNSNRRPDIFFMDPEILNIKDHIFTFKREKDDFFFRFKARIFDVSGDLSKYLTFEVTLQSNRSLHD
jgi:hypothetical protein